MGSVSKDALLLLHIPESTIDKDGRCTWVYGSRELHPCRTTWHFVPEPVTGQSTMTGKQREREGEGVGRGRGGELRTLCVFPGHTPCDPSPHWAVCKGQKEPAKHTC